MRCNNYQTIDVSSLAFTSQLVITNMNNFFFIMCFHWVTLTSPHPTPPPPIDSHPPTHYQTPSPRAREEDEIKSLKSQSVQWYEDTYYNSILVVEEMWTEDVTTSTDHFIGFVFYASLTVSPYSITQGVLRMKYTLFFFEWLKWFVVPLFNFSKSRYHIPQTMPNRYGRAFSQAYFIYLFCITICQPLMCSTAFSFCC